MPNSQQISAMIEQWDRRRLLKVTALGAAAFLTPGAFADALTQTPKVPEGPFYPDKFPLDTDNDLLRVTNDVTPAMGQITHLAGRILDAHGDPIRNALIEIWQCDNDGIYNHSKQANTDKRDMHFQGYGRFLTSSSGEYYFRTIKPVPYPGRTPHIHVKISKNDKHLLTTQMLNKDETERNEKDGLYRAVKDEKQRAALLADFKPIEGSKIDELAASWDVVLGWTPADEDPHDH